MTKTKSIVLLNIKYTVWIYSGHTKSINVHYKYLHQKLISPPQSESRRRNGFKFVLSPKRKFASISSGVLSTQLPVGPQASAHLYALGFLMPRTPDWHIQLEQRKTDGSWYSINLIVSCCKQILLIPVVHHRLWVTHIPDMPATVPYTGSQMHWWRELCINYLDGTCVRYQK